MVLWLSVLGAEDKLTLAAKPVVAYFLFTCKAPLFILLNFL